MPSVRVSITNLQSALAVDFSALRRAVGAVFRDQGERRVQISVAIVDDATIHDLNRRHLQHDYPTDVLSYPLEDTGERLQGEIVVSAETAQRQAPDYGWSGEEELCLYVVHGALHLAGYRDKSQAEQRAMQDAEREILREIGVEVREGDPRVPLEEEVIRPKRATPPRRGHAQAAAMEPPFAERDGKVVPHLAEPDGHGGERMTRG